MCPEQMSQPRSLLHEDVIDQSTLSDKELQVVPRAVHQAFEPHIVFLLWVEMLAIGSQAIELTETE